MSQTEAATEAEGRDVAEPFQHPFAVPGVLRAARFEQDHAITPAGQGQLGEQDMIDFAAETLLTLDQAGERLLVSTATIYRWIAQGCRGVRLEAAPSEKERSAGFSANLNCAGR